MAARLSGTERGRAALHYMTNNSDDPKRPLEDPAKPTPIEQPPERNPNEPRPLTDPVPPQEDQPRM